MARVFGGASSGTNPRHDLSWPAELDEPTPVLLEPPAKFGREGRHARTNSDVFEKPGESPWNPAKGGELRAMLFCYSMSATVIKAPARFTIDDLRERLVPALRRSGALYAVVFGSYARGGADGFSDLDLAVVLETTLPPFERPRLLDELYSAIPIGLDLLVFTPAEFEQGLRQPVGVFDPIAREGVTLYERSRDSA